MFSADSPAIEYWSYREIGPPVAAVAPTGSEGEVSSPAPPPGISEAEVTLRITQAVSDAERRWAAEAEARDRQRGEHMKAALEAFAVQRSRYFRQVEGEVVQLALAVARKILQREAALDPTLLHGLVRVALDRVGAEGAVRIRLSPEGLHHWTERQDEGSAVYRYELVADPTLAPGDCLIETDRGFASCGIAEQLKGIEQSFCDLLARRPETAV